MKIRRVVTGHNADGKAKVIIDDLCTNFISRRPHHQSCVVWSTAGFPVDNMDEADGSKREVSTIDQNGSVFRLVEYAPGVAPRNHRTESIDYAIVVSGSIDMDLDGQIVHLSQGDVLVQRGTMHNWINHGDIPCVIAFVLLSAKPVSQNGQLLDSHG